jgi:hypothetical protein
MEYFRQRFIEELNEEGDIEIRGITWPREYVLKTMDAAAYAEAFREWTDQAKSEARQRAFDFLAQTECLERFRLLVDRHTKRQVIPFVGAGMSLSSGFARWAEFLISLLGDAPHEVENVRVMLANGAFEEAAQHVHDVLTPGVFNAEIAERMGAHKQRADGAINLLPHLFGGEVVTTNFDHVLVNAFRIADQPFGTIICGADMRAAPVKLGNDNHALLRLHGDADIPDGRVLTLNEYNAVYAEGHELKGMLTALIGIRSFLFLGCSLTADRTLAALADIKAQAGINMPPHFAFLPLPAPEQRLERRTFLERSGIHPIYYPPDDHEPYIEDMLISILEGGI